VGHTVESVSGCPYCAARDSPWIESIRSRPSRRGPPQRTVRWKRVSVHCGTSPVCWNPLHAAFGRGDTLREATAEIRMPRFSKRSCCRKATGRGCLGDVVWHAIGTLMLRPTVHDPKAKRRCVDGLGCKFCRGHGRRCRSVGRMSVQCGLDMDIDMARRRTPAHVRGDGAEVFGWKAVRDCPASLSSWLPRSS